MLRHHITKYGSDGKRFCASWLQLNVFGKHLCFSKKIILV